RHDQRGGGDHAARGRRAAGHRLGVVARGVGGLADPREQEHLVVHGQAEEHREEDDRHRRGDQVRPFQVEQVLEPAPLEHRHHDPVGRADRQQVHHGGIQRHRDGAEHHHQQQERRGQGRGDEDGQGVGQLPGEVVGHGGQARHGDVGREQATDAPQGLGRLGVRGGGGGDRGQHHGVPGGGGPRLGEQGAGGGGGGG